MNNSIDFQLRMRIMLEIPLYPFKWSDLQDEEDLKLEINNQK